ncbi:ADP-ribosylglycohydrolase family protein [Streptomyces sp. NK08204]|uniref:ADP-ribosylglycohydrolase family protein n=1 Tax=Streptomyces sp. NK08204 TaxID=2873260 RepID=UPI001CEDD287|nr:ADP-ribosylglycohydrolase family protein [Streptomyces sp. NK08204]
MLRLSWVQPEDLLGHELRQARLDGREPSAVETRWRAAGGPDAPRTAGSSAHRASRYLRLLAEDLLDELADLPSRLADDEPTDLAAIKASCPDWPDARPDARPDAGSATGSAVRSASPSAAPFAAPPSTAPALLALEAAWLGRAAGCLLGRPVKTLPLDGVRALARATGNRQLSTWFTAKGVSEELLAQYPWNHRAAATSLAENIDGMPEDKALDRPLLGLLLLRRHGKSFTTADVARLWLEELPPGRTCAAERLAHRNLLCGIEPPHTARHRNPFREWTGALVRADVHGWTNPGDPAAAAEQAHRDAVLTHTANGVYAAMFTAAAIAAAATGTYDVHACLRTGRTVVPARSRLARAIDHAVRVAGEHGDFDKVVDELHARYAATHHWLHAVPNSALITAALTHADGDFTGSVCRAVSGGWDTGSNGATAGSVAGLLAGGPDALPAHWRAPLKNRLATTVADFDGTGFDALAHLTHLEATRP